MSAGAIQAGLDCLRRAVHLSARIDDPPLQIRALTSLGSALVHGLRGSDTEGAVTLHHAIAIGQERDEGPATAPAHRELGWVAVQQGRQHQAITWLDRAAELADSPAEHARILGVRGITLDDTGRHRDALETLCASGRLAAEHNEVRQLAWTLAMRARTHLQLGEHSEAEPLVAEALRLTRLQNWNAFLSYPLTQLAELQLLDGDHDAAVENLEHALALGRHIGDPCWEALAGRGLAWELSMRGKADAAVAELESARRCCGRHPDTYRWVTAQILAATCEIGVTRNLPSAPRWVDELEAFSGAAGLRDLVVRAHLHRARSAPRRRSRPRPSWPWISTTPPCPSRPPSSPELAQASDPDPLDPLAAPARQQRPPTDGVHPQVLDRVERDQDRGQQEEGGGGRQVGRGHDEEHHDTRCGQPRGGHEVEHRPAGVAEGGQVQRAAPEEQPHAAGRESGAGWATASRSPTATAMIAAISERWP